MQKTYFLSTWVIFEFLKTALAFAGTSSFFANPEIQAQAPKAFALQKEASVFVQEIEKNTLLEREALI